MGQICEKLADIEIYNMIDCNLISEGLLELLRYDADIQNDKNSDES